MQKLTLPKFIDDKKKEDKNIPYCSYGPRLYGRNIFKKAPNDQKR